MEIGRSTSSSRARWRQSSARCTRRPRGYGIRDSVLVSQWSMQRSIDACASADQRRSGAGSRRAGRMSPATERARTAGVKTLAISPIELETDQGYNDAVLAALQENRIDLVCLAGYSAVLGQNVISAYAERIMNVHLGADTRRSVGKGMYGQHHVPSRP